MAEGSMPAFICAGALVLIAAGGATPAQALDTTDFLAACTSDPVVTDEPGFSGDSKVTPQIYCECIAGKFEANKLSQSDVDILAKMHRDEITDEDAATYATLEDVMRANEGIQDDCKESLGMPVGDMEDEEGPPLEGEDIPQDE